MNSKFHELKNLKTIFISKPLLQIFLVTVLSVGLTKAVTAATITKNFAVKEFSKLKTGSAFHVEFIHSNENKVDIEIDEDMADKLFVENSGDELTIKLKDYSGNNIHTMKAKVYGNTLSELTISGAAHFKSDYTFTEKNIDINSSGASKVDITINTENLNMEISGASKVITKGNADKQIIEISGASNYNGKECKSANITIESSGASKASINCTDTLNVEASGASHITYTSVPKNINKETSGASSVELK